MREQNRIDAGFVGFRDVGENDVLVRGQAEFEVRKFFRDLAQRGFQLAALHVLDAAGFDEQGRETIFRPRPCASRKIAGAS